MNRLIIILLLLPLHVFAAEITHINNSELKQLIEQNVPVIDVRTISEWKKTGVIEGSHLMMFYDEKGKYNLEAWLDNVSNVAPKNKPVILICHSGSRSKQLAKYLTKVVGYNQVYNVKKGIAYWKRQSYPTVLPKFLK